MSIEDLMPDKNKLPTELQYCFMEIYRKEQNLSPLLNEVRNEAISDCLTSLKGKVWVRVGWIV